MKKFFLVISLLFFSFLSHAQQTSNVERKVPLADPFIMLYNDVYYAYGTSANDGIAVYTSTDMCTWKLADSLALKKQDTWGNKWFWAPEVYEVKGKFYMYFTANEHIGVAVSDNPLGAFTQIEKEPMIADEPCIDNSLFIDDDGKPYLFFVRFNDGLNIWVAEMEDDLLHIKPHTMHKCINVSQDWEKVWPRVNEGVFVIKRGGTYYITYSANSYESQFYGIGFATADSIRGTWTKYERNPILQKPYNLVGVGHGAIFIDKDGVLRYVFHAHKDTKRIHPREMYITTIYFEMENGKEVMRISPDFITPVIQ